VHYIFYLLWCMNLLPPPSPQTRGGRWGKNTGHTLSKFESLTTLLSPCTNFGFRTNGFPCWKSETKLSISFLAKTCPASHLKQKKKEYKIPFHQSLKVRKMAQMLRDRQTGWIHLNHEQGGKTDHCQRDQIQDGLERWNPAIEKVLAAQVYQRKQIPPLSVQHQQ
jgi:hypothetical protein